MPHLFLLVLITGLGLLSAVAAVALWPRVRDWCEESLFPWLACNLPQLAPHVRDAFASVDHAVTAARRAVKQAWQRLREHLLHQVVILERQSSSQWLCWVTSWVVRVLGDGRRVPAEVVTKEVCSWDELPSEVRSEWLRQGLGRHEIKASQLRDEELAAVC
jgi:hypothetical protein